MATVKSSYTDRSDTLPIAAGTSGLVLDIDFRDYTSDAEFEAANTNFDMYGTGSTWSSTLGWNGNGTNYFRNLSFELIADLQYQGTILIEVEAKAVAVAVADNAAYVGPPYFHSYGTAAATTQMLCTVNGHTGNDALGDNRINMYRQGADGNDGQFTYVTEKGNDAPQTTSGFINSHRSAVDNDDGYIWIGATWGDNDQNIKLLIDGYAYGIASHTNTFDGGVFQRMHFASNTGGAQPFTGYIRRLQVLDRPFNVHKTPVPVAFFGDSFMNAFMENANFTSDSNFAALHDASGRAGKISGLSRLNYKLFSEQGFILRKVYGATMTENGAGYSSGGANQLDATNTNAVIAVNPEIIITSGSVNDAHHTPSDLYGDTTGVLDTLIDGCSNLRKIFFLNGFEGWKGHTGNWSAADKATHLNNIAINNTLNGYRDIVEVIDSHTAWGGQDDYDQTLTQGVVDGTDNDVHPSSTGQVKMADIIYDAIKDYLTHKVMR